MDIVQEHEKLHAKVTRKHKGLRLNHEKCPRNSTTAIVAEGVQRGQGEGAFWGRDVEEATRTVAEGRVGIGLRQYLKISSADRRGIFSTFLCLLIHFALPQLRRSTQPSHLGLTVDELKPHQMSGQIPSSRCDAGLL